MEHPEICWLMKYSESDPQWTLVLDRFEAERLKQVGWERCREFVHQTELTKQAQRIISLEQTIRELESIRYQCTCEHFQQIVVQVREQGEIK